MDTWLKQTPERPLYPELEWEKPERKDQAGSLMIVGGNLHGFSSVAKAFERAEEAGIGSARILLPDALRRTLAPLWTDAIFCPSTATGSFSKNALDMLLQNALSVDGIIISGDLGRNSETAIVLDTLISSYRGPIALTRDALDYFIERPSALISRSDTLIIGSFSQLQKLFASAGSKDPLVYTMPLASLVGSLSRFTSSNACTIITRSENQLLVAESGRVVTTRRETLLDVWRLDTATKAIVARIQHPLKAYQAIVHSVLA